MNLNELIKFPEKQEEFTNDHTKTSGVYSHSEYGQRFYNIEYGQGWNACLEEIKKLNDREVEGLVPIDSLELHSLAITCWDEEEFVFNPTKFCKLVLETYGQPTPLEIDQNKLEEFLMIALVENETKRGDFDITGLAKSIITHLNDLRK